MVSYGPGVLMFGGRYSDSVEYLLNGTTQLLGGKVPNFDLSCSTVTSRNTVIFTGGLNSPTSTWEFDIMTGAWFRLPHVPGGGRYAHACSFVNRDGLHGVLIAGGTNGRRLQSSSFFYNIGTRTWSQLHHLPQPRWGPKMANVDGDTYLLGGGDGHNFVPTVLKFDFSDLSWRETGQNLQYPRVDFSIVVLQSVCTNASLPLVP